MAYGNNQTAGNAGGNNRKPYGGGGNNTTARTTSKTKAIFSTGFFASKSGKSVGSVGVKEDTTLTLPAGSRLVLTNVDKSKIKAGAKAIPVMQLTIFPPDAE